MHIWFLATWSIKPVLSPHLYATRPQLFDYYHWWGRNTHKKAPPTVYTDVDSTLRHISVKYENEHQSVDAILLFIWIYWTNVYAIPICIGFSVQFKGLEYFEGTKLIQFEQVNQMMFVDILAKCELRMKWLKHCWYNLVCAFKGWKVVHPYSLTYAAKTFF